MKKLKILSLLLLSVVFSNCSDDSKGQNSYNGDNALFFDVAQSKRVIMDGTTDFVETSIDFATLKAPSSSYQVRLVYDAVNSTAVQGVDFDIVSDVATVEAGELHGSFVVKVYDATAVSEGKKAIFTLESADLESAAFKNKMELNITLSCQLDLATFPLSYDVEVIAFGEQGPTHQQTLTVVTGQENTFNVASVWGTSFVAWATNNATYEGQFIYPGRITINCDNTVEVTGIGSGFTGGSGTFDPETGMIDVVITQSVFSDPFTVQCIFYPVQ